MHKITKTCAVTLAASFIVVPRLVSGHMVMAAPTTTITQPVSLPRAGGAANEAGDTNGAVGAASAAEQARIVHVLNRMAFGPRPGEVDEVATIGLQKWIDAQLDPASIDDSAVEQKLAGLKTLTLSNSQLMVAYAADRMKAAQKKAAKRETTTATPAAAAAPATAEATAANPGVAADATVNMVPTAADRQAAADAATTGDATGNANATGVTTAAATTVGQQAAVNPPRARAKKAAKAEGVKAQAMMAQAQEDGFAAGEGNQVVGEMETAKLVRAVESKRQLEEVLVDFWSNHFNLDVKKGPVKTLRLADERDVIRPHVLGKFRDLLEASAKSPAMMVYLDNARSTRPITAGQDGQRRRRLRQGNFAAVAAPANGADPGLTATATEPGVAPATGAAAVRGGLNENYAREIMELHTLGVDGGYTQQDVTEVARCFTGWGVDRDSGNFMFHPFLHDNGSKVVLGHNIAAGGGIEDGETVLDILANDPHTAHHLAFEMCQRFVADAPPAALVNRVAAVYAQTGGDLKAMTRTIVTSPEFMSPANTANKIKSPFEYVVSAARAMGAVAQVPDPSVQRQRVMLIADGAAVMGRGNNANRRGRFQTLPRELATLGEPMYSCQPPTGYPEDSSKWVSTGALVERLNFALDFANGLFIDLKLPEARPTEVGNGDSTAGTVTSVAHQILGGDLAPTTEKTVLKQFPADTPVDLKQLYALVLGSPDFQRR